MEYDNKQQQIEFLQSELVKIKARLDAGKDALKAYKEAHESTFEEAKALRQTVSEAKKELESTSFELCNLLKEGDIA